MYKSSLLIILLSSFCFSGLSFDQEEEKIEEMLEAASKTEDVNLRLFKTQNALSQANKLLNDSLILKSLDLLSASLYKIDSLEAFKRTSIQLLEKAESVGDPFWSAEAHFNLGTYSMENENNSKAYYHFNEAVTRYSLIHDSINIASNLLNMSILRINSGSYFESEQICTKGLQYLKPKSEVDHIYLSYYINLGICNNELGFFDQAIQWYNKALPLVTQPIQELVILNNLGVVLRNSTQYSKALVSFNNAFEFGIDIEQPAYTSMVKDNIAYTRFLNGDNDCREQLFEAYQERVAIDNTYGMTVSSLHIAEYELGQNRYDNSKKYVTQAFNLATKNGDSKNLVKALSFLIKHFPSSNYISRYIDVLDSLKRSERLMANKFASIDYQAENRKKENDKLQIENQSQQVKIARSKLQNQLLWASIVAFTIIFTFIYYALIQKRKLREKNLLIEKLESKQEERNRISAQLHDDIASDLLAGIHKIDLFAQKVNDAGLNSAVDLFDRSYEKMRSIAHDERSFSFEGKTFEYRLTKMVSDYSKKDVQVIQLNGLNYIDWINVNSIIKYEILLIIKEALSNITKHANANQVNISFLPRRDSILFKVNDNGVGLKVNSTNGIGMLNMQRRVDAIKGSLDFIGNGKKGAELRINIPM